MRPTPGKYLFYTIALSALLTPFAMQADEVQPVFRPLHGAERPQPPGRRLARMVFQRLDVNGDGGIDADEFAAPERGGLERFDENGDGAVTLEEMRAVSEKRVRERVEARFARLDGNGDGQVTIEEVRAQRFQMLDRNGDGTISPRELFRARQPQPEPPAE